MIVLPGVNPEDAIANAERIRSAVEALNIVNSVASPAGTLTVSIGVASRVPTASDSPDQSRGASGRPSENISESPTPLTQLRPRRPRPWVC